MDLENKFGAHNYHPMPVVWKKAKGCTVWDVDGKKYLDFLAAYGAVNQGHAHPRIIKAATQQLKTLGISSRAFYSDLYGTYAEFITGLFGYDKVLPMNTGAEVVETALKLTRRWGHDVKGIKQETAKVIWASENFHGRTIGAISASTDPDAYGGYGPFVPGYEIIPYNDIPALEELLDRDGANIAGFILEPLQGEAGVVVPDKGYLSRVRELCTKHNILMVCDEVQSGIGRTGRLVCIDHEGVRPDILILGKALSGGVYPVAAVLADDEVMLTIKHGQHGSTFGGNPVACAVAIEAMHVLLEEELPQNAERLGHVFRENMNNIDHEMIEVVRGQGLMNAVVVRPKGDIRAIDVCHKLAKNGVLAKPTHEHIIRFTPPLCITDKEIERASDAIAKTFRSF